MHVSGDRCSSLYRDDNLGVQMEKWCHRREGDGPMGYEYYGGGIAFFIDGDKTEYKTQDDMLKAYRRRTRRPAKQAN